MDYNRENSFKRLTEWIRSKQLTESVCKEVLLSLFREVTANQSSRDRRRHLTLAIGALEHAMLNKKEIIVCESLPETIQTTAETKLAKTKSKRIAASLTFLINATKARMNWPGRNLQNGNKMPRINRLARLDAKTLDALVAYEDRATQLKSKRIFTKRADGVLVEERHYFDAAKPLSAYARNNRIDRLLALMSELEIYNISELTTERLATWLQENNNSQRCLRQMRELETLFANLVIWKLLPSNPISPLNCSRPDLKIKTDFITPENLDRLTCEAISNQNTKLTRAFAVCTLLYDSCLRIRELASLRLSDIDDDQTADQTIICLKGSYQKGYNKPTRLLPIYFQETRIALRKYISEIRGTKEGPLLLGRNNQQLSVSAISNDIKKICKALDISTQPGNAVSAHVFRHTFATLNVDPLGLSLSLDEIVSRLRHTDRELAQKIYITDNPYVERLKLAERTKISHRRNPMWNIDDQHIRQFITKDLGLPPELADEICTARYLKQQSMDTRKPEQTVSEADALGLLKIHKISATGLRKHAQSAGFGRLRGKVWRYAEQHIWSLRNDYITIPAALKRLQTSRRTLYNHKLELKLCRIGRVSLVNKAAVCKLAQSVRRWKD